MAKPSRTTRKTKVSGKTGTSGKIRRQYGAIPYRLDASGAVDVLLVTSRDSGRWIIPKGWPIKNVKPLTTAKTEAFEEAGVRGEGRPEIGEFRYVKRMAFGKDQPCRVGVFPLRVTKELDAWPEAGERERRWFTLDEAAAALTEPELKDLVLKLPSIVRPV